MSRLVLGTRGSKLALAQSEGCAEMLRRTGLSVEARVIRTTSDHRPDEPLSTIDQRDVFTRQLDEALLAGEIDFAVHSMKDIPTGIPEGMVLAAITERHDPSDALVSDERYDLDSLPEGATVATSSLRRRAQLLHHRPDLEIAEIRGNVDTRIRKMRGGAADALLLARAGLSRLGLDVPHTVVAFDVLLPAVGQGALAVTMLEEHPLLAAVRETLNDEATERAVLAERAMMRELEGGCRVPVGGHAFVEDGKVHLRGLVASVDGALSYRAEASGAQSEEVGRRVARDLLGQGAAVILGEAQGARRP